MFLLIHEVILPGLAATLCQELGPNFILLPSVANEQINRLGGRVILLRKEIHISYCSQSSHYIFVNVQVNTQAAADVVDCSDRNNSKYYLIVVQVHISSSYPAGPAIFIHTINQHLRAKLPSTFTPTRESFKTPGIHNVSLPIKTAVLKAAPTHFFRFCN